MFFLLFLLDDRRIQIRSRTRIRIFDKWIWIREAQKHMDPTDPDPQHWFYRTEFGRKLSQNDKMSNFASRIRITDTEHILGLSQNFYRI